MSLVANINRRRKQGTSRSKETSTVSPEAYAEMKAGYKSGGMIGQMSDQMDISTKEAGGLMKKAKKMNKEMGYMKGGHVYDVTHGSEDVPIEWGRKKLKSGTEQMIQSTENQVRGRYFNDNDGKGTF